MVHHTHDVYFPEENSSSAAFSPDSHSFNVGVAAKTKNLNAAVIFNHLFFWLKHNFEKKINQHEGRTWMFDTIPTICLHVPYFTEQQVKDALAVLVTHGYILKGNFSKNKFDRTNWYAVCNEDWLDFQKMFSMRSIDPMDKVHRPDQKRSIDPIDKCQKTCSPPYIYSDNNTYIRTDNNKNIAQSAPQPRQKGAEISFSFDSHQFQNISDADLKAWEEIYPGIDIERELKEMTQWILANPTKARSKRQWRKFILGWLQRSNEKSTNRTAYQQMKSQQQKADVLSRHTGLQQDHSPRNPRKVIDLSECT